MCQRGTGTRGWVTLPLLGKQVLWHWEGHQEHCDWYSCLWDSPTCIQQIKGLLIASGLRKSLSPFLWVLEYHVRCISYFLLKAVTPLARTKNRIFYPTLPLPLLIVIPRVRSRCYHICILPCLSGVMYKPTNVLQFWKSIPLGDPIPPLFSLFIKYKE